MKIHHPHKYQALHNLSVEKGELTIGHHRITDIVAQYNTPLYIYDGQSIKQSLDLVREALPQFEVFFSVKANPSLGICYLLKQMGAGAEIASAGELELVTEAGFPPQNIIFAGPAKTDEELSLAVNHNIASINVESINELLRLEKIAKTIGKKAKVCIRVNTKQSDVITPEVMVGSSSKFGIDEELLPKLLRNVSLKHIEIIGVHVYTASQILKVDSIVNNLYRALTTGNRLARENNLAFNTLIFGGGFGLPNKETEPTLEVELLSEKVQRLLTSLSADGLLIPDRLVIELGRFLVGAAGIFVTKVIDIKVSRGETFVITDGGMNQFLRPVFMNVNHPTLVLTKLGQVESQKVKVGGPLCTPIDIIAKDINIPDVEEGDLIGFFNAGAYGYSMSPLEFLGHDKPPEIMIWKDEVYLIKERQRYKEVIESQIPFMRGFKVSPADP